MDLSKYTGCSSLNDAISQAEICLGFVWFLIVKYPGCTLHPIRAAVESLYRGISHVKRFVWSRG